MVYELKAYYIVDDNGRVEDLIIGQEDEKQMVLEIKDCIEKRNDSEWIKYRVIELPIELPLEGIIHNGNINIITTIKLNNIPCRAILNNFYNLVEIVEGYMSLENDYRKFTYHTEFIKINQII